MKKILAIETSCDETAVAILEGASDKDTHSLRILTSIISSQAKLHAQYGGVFPALAAREHVKNIRHVFDTALKDAHIQNIEKEIDVIAVTRGPGLSPSLVVGITFAKTIAHKYNKPLIGVNHMEGHIYSNWLEPVTVEIKDKKSKIKDIEFPILNLVVSGGHTDLVLMPAYGEFRIIGETLDDAIGEAFDKVARLLGLGYPGGPIISKLAEDGNPHAYPLPVPMLKSGDYNFSYSGLKTAVLYLLRDLTNSKPLALSSKQRADIAASFQHVAIEGLLRKLEKAAQEYQPKTLMLSGGVSANKLLRLRITELGDKLSIPVFIPPFSYTTDNAAMIAVAAYMTFVQDRDNDYAWENVEMDPNLRFPLGS